MSENKNLNGRNRKKAITLLKIRSEVVYKTRPADFLCRWEELWAVFSQQWEAVGQQTRQSSRSTQWELSGKLKCFVVELVINLWNPSSLKRPFPESSFGLFSYPVASPDLVRSIHNGHRNGIMWPRHQRRGVFQCRQQEKPFHGASVVHATSSRQSQHSCKFSSRTTSEPEPHPPLHVCTARPACGTEKLNFRCQEKKLLAESRVIE